MADVITNAGQALLGSGDLDWPASTGLVATLYNSSATFNADSNVYSNTNELSTLNGYTQLNLTLSGKTVTIDDANDETMYDCSDISWTATSGDIGPARYCAIVNGEAGVNQYVYVIDFTEDKTANASTEFKITINSSGLFRSRQGS